MGVRVGSGTTATGCEYGAGGGDFTSRNGEFADGAHKRLAALVVYRRYTLGPVEDRGGAGFFGRFS